MASGRNYIDKQTSFAGGRFSSELHGRTDLAKYASAFKDSKNFFVTPEGTLVNRAGTEHVDKVEPTIFADGTATRLIPFVFSDDDVVVLALGGHATSSNQGFIRFYKYDRTTDSFEEIDVEIQRWIMTSELGLIEDEVGETSPPSEWAWVGGINQFAFTGPEAADLRFVQSGDTIYFAYEAGGSTTVSLGGLRTTSNVMFRLRRVSEDSDVWRYDDLSFRALTFPNYGGTPRLKRVYDETLDEKVLPQEDTDHPARPWEWAVSRVMQTSDGDTYETLPYIIKRSVEYRVTAYRRGEFYGRAGDPYAYVFIDDVDFVVYPEDINTLYRENWFLAPNGTQGVDPPQEPQWDTIAGDALTPIVNTFGLPLNLVCYADRPMVIDWRVFYQQPEDIPEYEDTIVATRIYKGRDGHFGYVGQVGPLVYEFVDDGLEPDFATPPRSEQTHLDIRAMVETSDENFVTQLPEQPSVLGMYEGRFILAATPSRPGLVVGSAVDEYRNIDSVRLPNDADPYAFELASRRWEKIRFLVARHGLYIFTSEGEWVAAGSGQFEILTPNSLAVRQVSDYGSSKLEPLVVGETVLFVENLGSEPRAFFMQGMQSKSVDMVSYSREFFRGRQVVSWCWAEVPWQTLWLAMDDGKLLSCVWHPEQQLVAWAEHEVQGGLVKSIVSIPADKEHAPVLLVQRGSTLHLERMQSRLLTDVRDSKFLDAHVFYDGRNTSTNTAKPKSIADARSVGDTIDVFFTSGTDAVQGENLNRVVRVYGTKTTVAGTDEYGNDIETTETVYVEVLLTVDVSPDTYQGELLTPLEEDIDDVESTSWELCTRAVYGLDHLEGETVKALADGDVVENLVVEGGRVLLDTLPDRFAKWAAVICVGLGYDCDFESLAMAPEKGRQRVVRSVLVETFGSRGGYVGQDLDDTDNLEEVLTREVQHDYGTVPLKTEETPTNIRASYDIKGTIGFRQSAPLPISIISVVRDVEFGDR